MLSHNKHGHIKKHVTSMNLYTPIIKISVPTIYTVQITKFIGDGTVAFNVAMVIWNLP